MGLGLGLGLTNPNPNPKPNPNQVTNSQYRRLEREGIKTRVYENDALPLAQPGVKATQGTMHLQAYFTPDLPDDIKLDPVKVRPTPAPR